MKSLANVKPFRGDHHIYCSADISEIITLQAKAKPYQVKQVRDLILKYRLGGERRAKI
ncbi:MAG TPA: hypothetical protein PKO36_07330 [Candidatus Hydrogenedentes bacterium]|nr:hypothetical protein [Candidatus Hydrogenedentota bacterium]HOT51891.1 hypothetical protein [Candidatus Hydrogenedentota bacterium]HOV73141.1 hypothetical protein [Candidatus Hydrogenedentota bacterium]HRT18539.1 hypothetical protein [Candidatus Hydrogenedentota bacterium]HRT63558.1 hypothetical protein [Candidatus Hydrogenedentota bacterium]